MLIDSEKLKKEIKIAYKNEVRLGGNGLCFQTIERRINEQEELGGWQTGTPKKNGWYACLCDHGIETGILNYYVFNFEKGRFRKYDEYIRVVKWIKLPPYEEEK